MALFARMPAKVGPFETTMALRPSLSGHTVVHLAPLGTIDLDTHDWPVVLDLTVDEIAVADAERIAENPAELETLGDDAADEVRSALTGLIVRSLIVALIGGIAGALAARLSWITALGGGHAFAEQIFYRAVWLKHPHHQPSTGQKNRRRQKHRQPAVCSERAACRGCLGGGLGRGRRRRFAPAPASIRHGRCHKVILSKRTHKELTNDARGGESRAEG